MTLPGLQQPRPKQVNGWIDDLVGALTDPIICWPSPWSADIPENIKKQIPLERLIMNMKVSKEGGVPVGDCEALIYMYPRSLEAPMGYEWTHIYSYCFTKAMIFMKVDVPPDIRVDSLSDYDMRQLDDLKRFIYDKRVQNRKEKARVQEKEVEKKELEVKPAQSAFF
ncbi:MAG: hypothetical protein JXA46_11800 [Dehalococcoidales bacterium]|nr:hypothetical protein [Dehalococcoidales bacterium]